MAQTEINQAYIIMSTKTGKPYIDDANASYLFQQERYAKAFVLDKKNVAIDGPKYYNVINLFSQCYAAGADVLYINRSGKKEKITLSPSVVERAFYNHHSNQIIGQLKQTKRKSFLPELKKAYFIMASKIVVDDDKVSILYATAEKEDEDRFLYLAFTDLDEYSYWSSRVKGWEPLRVRYDSLRRISKHHGVLFNPYGNNFVLTRKMMEAIQAAGGDADVNNENQRSD